MWSQVGSVRAVLLRNAGYFAAAGLLFSLGWLVGSVFGEELAEAVEPMLKRLADIAEKTEQQSSLYTAGVIFLNNLTACAVMVLFGFLLAVPTVLALFSNGMVIGVLFEQIGGETASLWEMIVFGLLPHGIFELPAVVISAAFGIKLGTVLLRPLSGKTRLQSFGFVWMETVKAAGVVVALLLAAALIEGTLTPFLLKQFVVG
jgi:stage II sporulation protein M